MKWLLTVGGVGHAPLAPGTWGSLVALVAGALLIEFTGQFGLIVALGVATAVGYSVLPLYLEGKADKDPSEVVIDEVVGQWIALLPVAVGAAHAGASVWALWPGLLTAFLAFRLFDIWKPGPIGWADRRPGAQGVMLDDVFAGLAAAVVVLFGAWLSHGVLGL